MRDTSARRVAAYLAVAAAAYLAAWAARGVFGGDPPPRVGILPRAEWIAGLVGQWDGRGVGLEPLILRAMHDPDSYQHVQTTYTDEGDHLIVTTDFRSRNAFGATVLGTVRAKVDLHGRVLEVLDPAW